MPPTYQLVEAGAAVGIRCLICRLVSWNPADVRNRYCGACHVFHDDLSTQIAEASARGDVAVPVNPHLYLSTACRHQKHGECRRSCKWCQSPCVCECHRQGGL